MPDRWVHVWETAVTWAAVMLAWAAGDLGSRIIAGGAGGGLRWAASEGRNLKTFAGAIIAGMICAKYMAPALVTIWETYVGPFADLRDAYQTCGFLSGMIGMTGVRLVAAIIEGRARRLVEDSGGDIPK
ncbi:hypothetical protein [uncultured Maritimibacter sp.]|jgi:hypothetical protein|uniref:hypothetical protein n=1 Tax=uncultured Maritimibacter sp. TaxID=991866 RepID=UPI002622B5FC|nr:hypothetical protein [uncultured Maritimibacter sp.]